MEDDGVEGEPSEEVSAEAPVEIDAPVVAVSDEPVTQLDLDLGDIELGRRPGAKSAGRVLKVVISLVVLLWLVQLFGVIYLLRRPVVIRDTNQVLAQETSVLPVAEAIVSGPDSTTETGVVESPDEPDIFIFTPYIQLYSLDGLKVFSVEIEVAQHQKSGRLTDAEKLRLQESLRLALEVSVSGRLREEVVDFDSWLAAMIVPHIEKYFSEREVDLEMIKVGVHNPFVQ